MCEGHTAAMAQCGDGFEEVGATTSIKKITFLKLFIKSRLQA
jgi:hypothetical protein